MSDFDKEAEREKLREKYEQDEAQREATEQMSELLLQGATMTNAHCSDCGDPVFRYDGTEFCPTCEKRVDRDGDRNGATGGDAGAADAAAGDQAPSPDENGEGESGDANAESSDETPVDPQTVEVTSPSDDATVKFGNSDATTDASTADSAGPDDGSAPAGGETGGSAGEDAAASPAETGRDPPASGGAPPRPSTGEDVERVPSASPAATDPRSERPVAGAAGTDGSASESLERARVTLAETVERFSRRALETDSPREAREYLETAREAAETLDATNF